MKILVIGGTQFVGRHFVEAALRGDHEVTLFNRGKTNSGLFADQVEQITGDRFEDIDRLDGRWDVAVDTCGYFPRAVRIAAQHLRDRVKRYLFVSTISVYRDFSKKGLDESAYLKTLEDPDVEELNWSTYGPLKTECEAVVTGIFDKRCLIVRPGVIAGPHDPTDRFSYWACRVGEGGEVLAPGDPDADIQLIDARDLAQWLVDCIEQGRNGTYNAAGPQMSFEAMLGACRDGIGSEAHSSWVDEAFLRRFEIDTSDKMPLFNPDADGRKAGLYAVDSSRARSAGLSCRPLAETAADVWNWIEAEVPGHEWKVGLDRLQEQQLLDRWHEASGSSSP